MKAVWVAWIVCLLGATAAPAEDLIPQCSAVTGWTQKGKVRGFVPDNLFDYMDGNAEGYILYGFQKMTGITCVSGERSILIDVSEMASPEMAYGMFTANRHPRYPTSRIGTAGQIMPRRATFAKGKYYVELAANGAKDLTEPLEAFIKIVEPRIPGPTDLPAILDWFPKEQLEKGSVRLVPQSVLGLRVLKRGYIARYDYGRAFLVKEASPEEAVAVLEKLKARLKDTASLPVADGGIVGTDRYLGRMAVARKGSWLTGYASIKDGEDTEARVSTLAAAIP